MPEPLRRQKSVLEDNKFYRTTGLGGFGLISSSNNQIEAAIWYSVIIIFSIITIFNVYTLTSSFLQRPTKTTVSIVSFNDTYALKTMRMSLRLGLPGFNPEYFRHYDTRIDDNDPPTNVTILEEVEKAIRELPTAFDIREYTWPYALMPLFGHLATHIAQCEQQRCGFSGPHPDLLGPTVKFIDHAKSVGINQKELMQIFGKQLLDLIRIPWEWKQHWWFTGIDRDLAPVSQKDGFLFSFRLMAPDGIKPEHDWNNVVHWVLEMSLYDIYYRQYGQWYAGDSRKWYNDRYKPYLRLSHVGGDEKVILVAPTENKHDLTAYMFMTASFHTFQRHENGEPSCTNPTQTMFECQYASINEFETTKYCNCAMTFTYNSPLVNNVTEFCGYEQYKECSHFKEKQGFSFFERYGSPKYCKTPRCDVDFVQLYHAMTISLPENIRESCRIKIRVRESEYPLFVEQLEQTFTDYLADLGGTFDLWIGASIIGIIHVVVYLTKQMIYAFKGNTKTGKNVRNAMENWRNKEPLGQMMTSLTLGLVATSGEQQEGLESRVEERLKLMDERIQSFIDQYES